MVVGRRGAVMPAKEGIYGLALPSGDVLFVLHVAYVGTITYPGHVLVQRAPDYIWGRQLKPGTYTSIKVHEAVARCVASPRGQAQPPTGAWRTRSEP